MTKSIDPETCVHTWNDYMGPLPTCERCGQVDLPEWAEGKTLKEMCEFVATVATQRFGVEIDPEAFFNLSASGALDYVFFAYWDAVAWLLREVERG